MSSQRPFFSNFLAAFRVHSAIQQTGKGPSTSSGVSPSSQPSHNTSASATTSNTASHPRSIATKSTGATTNALTQIHSPRANSTSPLSRSPGTSPSPGPTGGGPYMQSSNPISTADRMRRGSDSSSEGFRDTMGAEKWYIGGRTATGEERFFKLGVVKRHRSIDRLSLDRLSL